MPEGKANKYDAIIVGAGFSGLMASRELHRAGKEILLLEARDRVGGRTQTEWLDEHTYVDLGGQWIGPTQYKMYELVEEYGLSYFHTYDTGKSITHLKGKIKSYKGLIPPLPVPALLNLHFAIQSMGKQGKTIDLENPWLSKQAEKWDNQTLEEWMLQKIKFDSARRLFKIGIESIYACDLSEISALHALFYCGSGGDLDMLMNIDKGAQQDRVYGGMQTLAEKMADEFRDTIQFSTPVDKVVQSNEEVIVSSGAKSWTAKKIIITIPPPLAANIQYTPELPKERQLLMQQYFMGSVIKCYAIYDQPFWRKDGFNGLATSDEGYISVCFDNSPRDGEKGMIMGFVLAKKAQEFATFSIEKREQIVIQELTNYFGPSAAQHIQYIDKIWADEKYSGGCYAGMLPRGALTTHQEQLSQPIGNIHWAGTETSSIWNGYIEGAVGAGIRAAQEILGEG